MSLKEKWENFRNWAKDKIEEMKRKHMIENMEPKVLKDMVEALREDVKFSLSIKDKAEREEAVKLATARLAEVEGIVDDVLENVEKNIQDSMDGLDSWLSREAHARDLSGLRKGKATLLSMKEDLGGMKSELNGTQKEQEAPQSEPNA